MRNWRFSLKFLLLTGLLCGFAGNAYAASPTIFANKTAKIDADPKKDYVLTESDGNWFIMVKKFSGDNAAFQAKRLVYEFRAAYKMEAYVFKYDPDQMEMDALSQKLGKTKKFHYQTARAVEYAVLVGGFPTGEDPALQKALEKIRKCQPKSLQNDAQSKELVQQYKESAKQDAKYAGYGPLGGATPVPNPLLPIEYFNHKGIVDSFIAKLNSDCKYSLLNNKKMYTVRIATFSGDTSMKKSSDNFDTLSSRLQYAGMRAAALCEALRNEGVEAWEFHDRDCSFVTIGSFDQYGKLEADGHTELNPKIAEIMKKYGGELVNDESGASKYRAYTIVVDVPDPASTSANPKKKRMSLACDLRPVIIVVPQRSGEENVKKIALAQEQMNRAREKKEALSAALSLEEAEKNLDSVNAFANMNGKALTEEEYRAWTAQQGQSQRQSGAVAASEPARPAAQTAVQAATSAPYAAQATNAQPTAKQASRQQTAAAPATKTQATTAKAAQPAPKVQNQAQAQRSYPTSTQTKTAQRSAAPTY